VKKLVILTLEYPYGNGESFLANELDFYSKQNIKVYLVPLKTQGLPRSIPSGITLVADATKQPGWGKIFLEVIGRDWFWKEAIKSFGLFFFKSSRTSFLFFLKAAFLQRDNLLRMKSKNWIDPTDTVLYSYWLGGLTGGAISFNQQSARAYKIVSRAHGGDVYDYRYKPAYLPFREFVLKNIDRIATVSQDGAAYLKAKYPLYQDKITCFYLGTSEPGFVCAASSDGVFRIVSCAYVNPVKRLHLLAEALSLFQNQHPEIKIHWTHIGGGPLLEQLMVTSSVLTKTVTCSFVGNQTLEQIMKFYKETPADLFVNTSVSEGMPVSVMEAMSVGLPILATNVGGLKEMVDEHCGKLLPSDLSIQMLADEIFSWIKSAKEEQRRHSIKKWTALFDAKKNYQAFYRDVLEFEISRA